MSQADEAIRQKMASRTQTGGGAADPKAGAVKSIVRFPIRKTNHKLDVRGGVGEEESAAVLRDFFRARRKNGPARKSEPV